jgi:hypothetical protein
MTSIDAYALTVEARMALETAQTHLAAASDRLSGVRQMVAWDAPAARAFQDAAFAQWVTASALAGSCAATAQDVLARALRFADRVVPEP